MWKRSNKPPRTNKHRRGSVLVIVVAVLTMIALIGTAYIATARLDRYSAQDSVATAKKEATNEQYLDEVERMVRDAVVADFDLPVTGFRSSPWLADRLPQKMWPDLPDSPINPDSRIPIWRYITGKLDAGMDDRRFEPPLLRPVGFPSVDWYITQGPNHDGSGRFAAVPTSITLTYPNNYIVEKYRGKVRTFPAFSFFNPGLRDLATVSNYMPGHAPQMITDSSKNPYVYLAADADGDGIADSVLFRVSTGAIQGVTYYAAVRIIDNSSAININTARTIGDADYNNSNVAFDPTGIGLRTFFPSSIGLRELFHVAPGIPGYMPNPGMALWTIDEYRFGYDLNSTAGNSSVFDQRIRPRPVITDENLGGTTPALNPVTTSFNYSFATVGEALSMQLARRIESPGYRETNVRSRFRAFDEATSAALAYRFCMDRIDPESSSIRTTLSPFEDRMFNSVQAPANLFQVDGVVRSAPNYANTPDNTFRTFPANAVDDWFSWLNYEADLTRSMTVMPNAVFKQIDTNVNRFRSVRPLLTADNAVTNLIVPKENPFKWPGVTLKKVPDVLYPGMTITNPNPLRTTGSTVGIKAGDIIERTSSGQPMHFMYMGRPGSSPGDPPLTDAQPAGHMAPTSWEPQPYVSGHAKTSINTAGFPELWRAFFLTMNGPVYPRTTNLGNRSDQTPFDAEYVAMSVTQRTNPFWGMSFDSSNYPIGGPNGVRMFRSSIRDPQSSPAFLHRYQMMVLRSALAAVNTISLRDRPLTGAGSTIVPTRDFTLYHVNTNVNPPVIASSPQPYQVSVFGMVPQPFITEVYANNDTNTYGSHRNPNGYVAIELYNPYNIAINLQGWRLAILDRVNGQLRLSAPTAPIAEHKFGASDIVPAGGYLILESHDTASPGNTYRPPSSKLSLTGNVTGAVSVKILAQNTTTLNALGHEVVLLRPKDALNPPTTASAFADMVPVDQFDFTFGTMPLLSSNTNKTWHYVRSTSNWEFIYPGRYDGRRTTGHQQGVKDVTYFGSKFVAPDTEQAKQDNRNNKAIDPWNPSSGVSAPFQEGDATPTPLITLGSANSAASYNDRCVIPWETFLKGPPKITSGPGASTYQYGIVDATGRNNFARNADILQVPFIGAYVIKDNSGKVIEMNSVTMDSAFAEDTDPTNNEAEPATSDLVNKITAGTAEQVGRFCPLPDATWYDWAGRLFDYLDVEVPADDYLPNIRSVPNAVPKAVASHGQLKAKANRGNDDVDPSHGKINILTAPAKVLAMLPLVPSTAGLNYAYNGSLGWKTDPGTEEVARAIVRFRNEYWEGAVGDPQFTEAFLSILDLNRVPLVRAAAAKRAGDPPAAKSKQGNYYGDAANSGFDERFLIANRVSNLITTRSDTFTVYIVVQGWREADTNLPSLEWEQRKAFIIDRSGGPDKLKITPVPTD